MKYWKFGIVVNFQLERVYCFWETSMSDQLEDIYEPRFLNCKYYGVTFNSKNLGSILHFTQRYLCKALNRRSHMKSYTWDGFSDILKVYLLVKHCWLILLYELSVSWFACSFL